MFYQLGSDRENRVIIEFDWNLVKVKLATQYQASPLST